MKTEALALRIRQGYMLNETENSRTVVPMNPAAGGFQGSIRLNASAAMLYRMLENDASEDDLTNALLHTYQVTEERARADVVAFLDLLADTGLLID